MSKPVFRIDKNIPLPPDTRRHRRGKYPFDQLMPGESFWVGADVATARAVEAAASSFFKRRMKEGETGWTLAVRREGTGVRVFCVSRPGAQGTSAAQPQAQQPST